jgi:hypothetical protein
MHRMTYALAVCAALLAAGCGKSHCQQMEERLCSCTGQSSQACTTQVENLLKDLGPGQSEQDRCNDFLSSCNPPPGAVLCEWILTADGMKACGLAIEPSSATTTTP